MNIVKITTALTLVKNNLAGLMPPRLRRTTEEKQRAGVVVDAMLVLNNCIRTLLEENDDG